MEDLADRVEKLEKQQFVPQEVEAELVITKRSIKKAQDIMAFNTVGNALYILRDSVIQLETAHHAASKA